MGVKAKFELGYISPVDRHFQGLDYFFPALAGIVIPKLSDEIRETDDRAADATQQYRIILTPDEKRGTDYHFIAKQYRDGDDPKKSHPIREETLSLSQAEYYLITDMQSADLRHFNEQLAEQHENAFSRPEKKPAFLPKRDTQKENYSIDQHPLPDMAQQFGHAISAAFYETNYAKQFLYEPLETLSQDPSLKNAEQLQPLLSRLNTKPAKPLVEQYLELEAEIQKLKGKWFSRFRFGGVIQNLKKVQSQFVQHHQASEQYHLLNALKRYERTVKKRKWYKFQFTNKHRKQQLADMIHATKQAASGQLSQFDLLKQLDDIERQIPHQKSILKSICGGFRTRLQKRFQMSLRKAFSSKASDPAQYLSPIYACDKQLGRPADVKLLLGEDCETVLTDLQVSVANIKLDNPRANVYQSAFEHVLAPIQTDASPLGQTIEGLRSEVRLLNQNDVLRDTLESGLRPQAGQSHPFYAAKEMLERKMAMEFHGSNTPIKRVADWVLFKLSGYLVSSLEEAERRDVSSKLFKQAYPDVAFMDEAAFHALIDSDLLAFILLNLQDEATKKALLNQLVYTCKTWFSQASQSPLKALSLICGKMAAVFEKHPDINTKIMHHALKQMIAKGLVSELATLKELAGFLWKSYEESPEKLALIQKISIAARGDKLADLTWLLNLYLKNEADVAPLKEFPELRYSHIKSDIQPSIAIAAVQQIARMMQSDSAVSAVYAYLTQHSELACVIQQHSDAIKGADENHETHKSLEELKQSLSRAIQTFVSQALQSKNYQQIEAILVSKESPFHQLYAGLFDISELKSIVNEAVLKHFEHSFDRAEFLTVFYQDWRLNCANDDRVGLQRNNSRLQQLFHRQFPNEFQATQTTVSQLRKGIVQPLLEQTSPSMIKRCCAEFTAEQRRFIDDNIQEIIELHTLVPADKRALLRERPTLTLRQFIQGEQMEQLSIYAHINDMLCSDVAKRLDANLRNFQLWGLQLFRGAMQRQEKQLLQVAPVEDLDDYMRRLKNFSDATQALKTLDALCDNFNKVDFTAAQIASAEQAMRVLKDLCQRCAFLDNELSARWERLRSTINDILFSQDSVEAKQHKLKQIAGLISQAPDFLKDQALLSKLLANPTRAIAFLEYNLNLSHFMEAARHSTFRAVAVDHFAKLFNPENFQAYVQLLGKEKQAQRAGELRSLAGQLRDQADKTLWANVMEAYASAFESSEHDISVSRVVDSYELNDQSSPDDFQTALLLGDKQQILAAVLQWLQALNNARIAQNNERFDALLVIAKQFDIAYFQANDISDKDLSTFTPTGREFNEMLTQKLRAMIHFETAEYDFARTVSFLCQHKQVRFADKAPVRVATILAPGQRQPSESTSPTRKRKLSKKDFLSVINEVEYANTIAEGLLQKTPSELSFSDMSVELNKLHHCFATEAHESCSHELKTSLREHFEAIFTEFERVLDGADESAQGICLTQLSALRACYQDLFPGANRLLEKANRAYFTLTEQISLGDSSLELNQNTLDQLALALAFADPKYQAAMQQRIDAVCYAYLKQATDSSELRPALETLLPYSSFKHMTLDNDAPLDTRIVTCQQAIAVLPKAATLEYELWALSFSCVDAIFANLLQQFPAKADALKQIMLKLSYAPNTELAQIGQELNVLIAEPVTSSAISYLLNPVHFYQEHRKENPVNQDCLVALFQMMEQVTDHIPSTVRSFYAKQVAEQKAASLALAPLFLSDSLTEKSAFLIGRLRDLSAMDNMEIELLTREANYLILALDEAKQVEFKQAMMAIVDSHITAYQAGTEDSYPVIEKMCAASTFLQVICGDASLQKRLSEIIESHAISEGLLHIASSATQNKAIALRGIPREFELDHFIKHTGLSTQISRQIDILQRQQSATAIMLSDALKSVQMQLDEGNTQGIKEILPALHQQATYYNHYLAFQNSVTAFCESDALTIRLETSLLAYLQGASSVTTIKDAVSGLIEQLLNRLERLESSDELAKRYHANRALLNTLISSLGNDTQQARFKQLKATALCHLTQIHFSDIRQRLSDGQSIQQTEAMAFIQTLSSEDYRCMQDAKAPLLESRNAAIVEAQKQLDAKLSAYFGGQEVYTAGFMNSQAIATIQNNFLMAQAKPTHSASLISKELSKNLNSIVMGIISTPEKNKLLQLNNALRLIHDLDNAQQKLILRANLMSHLQSVHYMQHKRFSQQSPSYLVNLQLHEFVMGEKAQLHDEKLFFIRVKAQLMQDFLNTILENDFDSEMSDENRQQLAAALDICNRAMQSETVSAEARSTMKKTVMAYRGKIGEKPTPKDAFIARHLTVEFAESRNRVVIAI